MVHEFLLSEQLKAEALSAQLAEQLTLSQQPARRVQRMFLDSFDWRLFQYGGLMELESGTGEQHLSWRPRKAPVAELNLPVSEAPRFAEDLRPDSLRDTLLPVLEMRALQPRITLTVTQHLLALLDKEQKTVLRLVIESYRVRNARKAARLPDRLRILPVRGYEKPLSRLLRVLNKETGLSPAEDDLLSMALASIDRRPADYSSKLGLQLPPSARADIATKTILSRLLRTMQENESGTRQDLDSEFLHDFRVAVRRSRAALGQIKGVFPARPLERFCREFAWLGQLTGPTRDFDVYLLKFPAYRASLPDSMRDRLAPLHDYLEARQKREHDIMVKALNSQRYRHLIEDWRQFLEAPVPARSNLPNAARPLIGVADERIWKVFRRIMGEGGAINQWSPAESYHDLRKTCKKLRYLMEFFRSLYPGDKIDRLIKTLKVLQENLGDFQDLEVQAATLHHVGEELMARGDVPEATFTAIEELVANLQRSQKEAQQVFKERFRQFAELKNQQRFRELFKPRRQLKAG